MKKYYDILGLHIDATQKEIDEAYDKLYVVEYLKIVDAYNAISNKSKLGVTKIVSSNRSFDTDINQDNSDEEFITVKISKNNLKKASKESVVKDKSFRRFFTYDDEYISGTTYFLRSILNTFLSFLLIGIYMNSVTAYKRSKSLGHSDSTSNIWAIWGFLTIFLAYTPLVIITNTVPHWYLWFSNGKES